MSTFEEQNSVQTERRNFLALMISGLGILLFASAVYPIIRFISPPKREVKKSRSAVVATEADILPNTGKVVLFNGEKVLILNKDGEYHAMSAICTHLGCIVQWKPDEQLVWCACHNARYDSEGKIISGPQPRPLAPYKLRVQDGNIILINSEDSNV